MTDEEKRAIAREIRELITPPKLEEGWITASLYAEELDIEYKQASDDLKRAARRGQIGQSEEKVFHAGRWQWAYKPRAATGCDSAGN